MAPSHDTPVQAAAYRYLERGWAPIPVPARAKKATRTAWQLERWTDVDVPVQFAGQHANISLLPGDPSGGIADVDCDCPEALALANAILPPTASRFGRVSTPGSHRLYQVTGAFRKQNYDDPLDPVDRRARLVELRGTGNQTLAPPSIYPEGEACVWHEDGDPARVDASDLQRSVAHLAVAALQVRYWPGEGKRHEAALALGGGLARAGWSGDDAADFVGLIATVAGDDEVTDRMQAVRSSAATLEQDRAATGWPTLVKLIDSRLVEAMRDWLGIREVKIGVNASYEAFAPGFAPPDDPETRARLISVPAFPIEVFPPIVQQFLEAGARNVGCPVDLLALPFLGYVAAAIGRLRCIAIKPHWVRRATLWPGVVAASGVGKSPADGYVRAPLDLLQAEADLRYQEQFTVYKRDLARFKGKDGSGGEEEPAPPLYQHWYTTDPTMESLAPMLKDNPGIAAAFDELVAWVRGCNSYKRGGNDRQKYLEIWNGRSLKIDRKTQGVLYVPDPVLCVIGGIQPERLPELTREASVHDGLLSRFTWTYPDASPSAWDWGETSIDHLDTMVGIFQALRQPVSAPGPLTLRPHPNARDRWSGWYDANRAQRMTTDGPVVQAFASKFPAQLATLWLVLESLWHPADPGTVASAERLDGAIALIEYARAHARRVAVHFISAHAGNSPTGATLDVVDRVRTVIERAAGEWLSRTELSNALHRNMPAAHLDAALNDLTLQGVIESQEVSSGTNTREEWRLRSVVLDQDEGWSELPFVENGRASTSPANSSYEEFAPHVQLPRPKEQVCYACKGTRFRDDGVCATCHPPASSQHAKGART